METSPLQEWLDLDSGLLITNKSRDSEDRAGHDWIQTNGFDLVALTGVLASEQVAYLCGFDMVVEAAPTNSWDTLTVADVVHNWSLLNHLPQQRRLFSVRSYKSDTFFFQTREGGKGILQILGTTADHRAVQLRYKLVQPAGTNAAPIMAPFEGIISAPAATGRPAVERNPEVLRIRLGQAEAELARLNQLHAVGVVTEADLEAAQEKAEVLKAELEGDDVGVAQARLAAAQRAWERVSPLAKAGMVTSSEAEAAQTEVRVREAELKAAQAAHTNAAPKIQIDTTQRN
jgi:hypothetical protein